MSALGGFSLTATAAQVPNAIVVQGQTEVTKVHAEGAQIYECKAGSGGNLIWTFREPIATLIADGKTVGRHFAGPSWEFADDSAVMGTVTGTAPGATANDIPWLKVEVASQRGSGILKGVTTVQRLDTHGGELNGTCNTEGAFRSQPYSAEYVFLRKN
jgi:hypothetical protein